MKRRLFLAELRKGMSFYAARGLFQLMTEEEFLAQPDVQATLARARESGVKVRLMEDDPDPKKPNIFVRQLV